MIVIKHIPALQVVIPFFGAMISVLSFDKRTSFLISILSILSIFILSIIALKMPDISYSFGGWKPEIGIEYYLQFLNKSVLLFINGILLIFLCLNYNLINESILDYIQKKWQYLFFVLLLFAHAGYVGIVSTNDIFNLYVFIEISSLSAYVLMALGGNPKAPIGGLHYLIFGSIGATFILISIGFLFAITGSLNFTEIKNILAITLIDHPEYQIIFNTAIGFYVIGALLKISFFPIHFWMEKAYKYASDVILIYLASISSVMGVYILMKFLYFIPNNIIDIIYPMLMPITCFSILASSIIAMKSKKLNTIIVYGILLNAAYAVLFLLVLGGLSLVLPLLFIDGITKVGLFTIQAYYNNKNSNLSNIYLWKYLTAIIILCSAGLPLTPLFLIKIKMLKILLQGNYIYPFIVVLISFVMSIFYHYKMISLLFFKNQNIGTDVVESDDALNLRSFDYTVNNKMLICSLLLVLIIQFLLFINFDKL